MGQPIPAQHPSVVLRSHFKLVRTLLILAMAALLACSAAVVILANDEDQVNSAAVSKSAPAVQPQAPTRPARASTAAPRRAPAVWQRSASCPRARASTAAPRRAPAS